MVKIFTLFILCLLSLGNINAQDLRLYSISSPLSGCTLSNQEDVSIIIINVGSTLNSANVDVVYSINSGAPVVENLLLPPVFNNGGLIAYTFTAQADLSTPGTFNFKSFINLAGDINRTNDTISNYEVVSYPQTVGGSVTGSATKCNPASGTVYLGGYTGSVLNWESSPDNTNWSTINNNTDSLVYSGLSDTTYYRAIVKSGTCLQQYSSTAVVNVEQGSEGGNITGSDSVCSGSSGILDLLNHFGAVIEWQSSIDNGLNWDPVINTTTQLNYTNISSNTLFRVKIINGSCPEAFSDTAGITLLPASDGGFAFGDTTVCFGNNTGEITVSNFIGNIIRWEYSENALDWNPISQNSDTISFNNLIISTQYRAVIENCPPEAFSNIVTINVVAEPVSGILSGDSTVCAIANSGTLALTGWQGSISWESSTDNSNWNLIAGATSNTFTYNDLSVTTWFRTKVASDPCTSVYSNSVQINVSSASIGGILTGNSTVCITGNSGSIYLSQSNGDILHWESSTDSGLSWNIINSTDTFLLYNDVDSLTYFRVLVKNESCPAEYSINTIIDIDSLSVSGFLTTNDTVCYGSNGMVDLSGYKGQIMEWNVSFGDSLNWQAVSNSTPQLIYTDITQTAYYRTIVKRGACPADTSALVSIAVRIVNAFAGNDTTINEGTSATLNGSGGSVYLWSPVTTLSNANIFNPIANPQETTTYQLIVKDNYLCADTDFVIVTVTMDEKVLKIPNFISPNSDGFNDKWEVINIENFQSKAIIFNSNGFVLFEETPYNNNWDGKWKGDPVPDGIYYYILVITDSTGKETQYKGNITVLSKLP